MSGGGNARNKGRLARRLDVTVSRLASSGVGVGHVQEGGESRAVFIPRTAAGDVVSCDVDFATRPARGRVVSLLTASADRVEPSCESFSTCGGCDFLHLSPDAQMRAHRERVLGALRDVQHPPPTLAPFTPSGGARTRARLHVVADKRGRVTCGFFQEGSHDVVSVRTCVALDPALDRARAELPALLAGALGKGEALLALGAFEDVRRPVLSLSWDGELPRAVYARVETAVTERRFAGVRLLEKGAARPSIVGDPTPYTRGADGAPIALAPGGFAQATESPALAAVVIARAKELLGARTGKIVELYAGAGNFSVVLATMGALTTVEVSAEACEKARENLRARGLVCDVKQGEAESLRVTEKPELLVLDPPRTGARAVAETHARGVARSILYASCDPETLGRDLVILAQGYDVRSLDIVPCFPDTSHVEVVCALEKKRR